MTTSQAVAIVTLDGFNEIDSFVAARMIDSVPGMHVELAGPSEHVTSAAGITVATTSSISNLGAADAVIIGSGFRTFEHIEDAALMADLGAALNESQLIGSQCSGAAFLHRLGLLERRPVCTDRLTAARLEPMGVAVTFEPFRADGNLATAGGCLSSAYLATWIIDRLAGRDEAITALRKVAPVGEEDAIVARASNLLSTALT